MATPKPGQIAMSPLNRLDLHVITAVTLATLLVLGLTTILDLIFVLAEEFTDLDGDYGALNAVQFGLRTLPTGIYELLPFAALSGALVGLGMLASQHELVVMQAAGVSPWRIVRAVLVPTAVVMAASLWLGEFVAPQLEQQARTAKSLQQSGQDVLDTSVGFWRRVGNEFIHIAAIAPGGRELFGITRYRLGQDRNLVTSSYAERGAYRESSDGGYWELVNVTGSTIGEKTVTPEYSPSELWRVALPPELLAVLLVEPQRQTLSGLYRFARYFEQEGLESGVYMLSFWKKLLQPLSTLALVILAVSFVFGSLRAVSAGTRVLAAIGIGLSFTILQRIAEPAALLSGINPLLAVLLPITAIVVLGLYQINRVS